MIEKVSIKPGCIACKNCESVCPQIFKVKGKSMVINHDYKENIKKIIQARDMCPVKVIDVKLKDGVKDLDFSKKAEVLDKKEIAKDTIELKIKTNEKFDFIPGQYVGIKMTDKHGEFTRSYSIAYGDENSFTLNIKLLPDGRGSNVARKFKTGDKIRYIESSGDFVIKNNNKPKVFIATGTGLAPMIAMINSLPNDVKKTIIFGVRFEEDIYYKEILEGFKNTKLIITVSRPSDDYKGYKGRITDHLENIDANQEFYICGNPDMVESVRKELKNKGTKKEDINYEEFVSAGKKDPILKDIFINGNIKGLNILNWILIIMGIISPILLIKFPSTFYNLSFDISWWTVFLLMIIRPLADLFPNILLLRKLVVLRKGLGVLSGMVIVAHFINSINSSSLGYLGYIENYFSAAKWSGSKIIARLSEFTAFILVITSNTLSQRILGSWWKRIQKLAYVYFFTGGIYIYGFGKTEALYCMIIVGVLYIAAEIYKFMKKS